MHKEVLDNLESIQGALLRMNHSIQAEYKRIVRKYTFFSKVDYNERSSNSSGRGKQLTRPGRE